MDAKYTCKAGSLIISDRSVQVVKPFGNVVWNVQRSSIVGVSSERHGLSHTVIFQTAAGPFKAETLANAKAQEIIKMFN